MHVFLSYSHADKALAAKLRQSLEEKGLSFNNPGESSANGTSWRQQVEKAVRSADAILLLLSSRKKVDEHQQLTWRIALQAVWEDPAKRWIPLLLGDAKLPAFVRSGASGDEVEAIRIRDPKDLDLAIEAILRNLAPSSAKRARRGTDLVEIYPRVTDEDRARQREDFAAIQRYAEQLKQL